MYETHEDNTDHSHKYYCEINEVKSGYNLGYDL